MSPLAIRRTILRILAEVSPLALPTATLGAELDRLVRPAVTAEDLREHLSWLFDHLMVGYLPDALDPESFVDRRWHLKEAGERLLNS